LQRKLSTPEYKGVDERYRVAMIKHETTQIAADDLKKYYGALDKVSLFVVSCALA
jgi:DNA repair protein RAD50